MDKGSYPSLIISFRTIKLSKLFFKKKVKEIKITPTHTFTTYYLTLMDPIGAQPLQGDNLYSHSGATLKRSDRG